MPSRYSYSRLSDVIVIGSFEPPPRRPSRPPDFASGGFASGGFASGDWAPADVPTASATTSASSRPRRIVPQDRVHLAEQPHAPRRHVDLEPEPTHVERLAVDGDDAGCADAVGRVVVVRGVGADLQVVEHQNDLALDRHGGELLPFEREPSLIAGQLGAPAAPFHEE